MPGGMSLWEYIQNAAKRKHSKKEWGALMHNPDTTEEEKLELMKELESAEGYENLPD